MDNETQPLAASFGRIFKFVVSKMGVRQGQVFKNSSQLVKLSIIMLKANREKHLSSKTI